MRCILNILALIGAVSYASAKPLQTLKATGDDGVIPSLPWVQHGDTYVHQVYIPLDVARECTPEEYEVVEALIMPGYTTGALVVTQYDDKSTVAYSELIMQCAEVRYKNQGADKYNNQRGGWVGAIYVDSEQALNAGINIWGLPKQLATFSWTRDTRNYIPVQRVNVKTAQGEEVVLDAMYPDASLPLTKTKQTISTFGITPNGTHVLSTTVEEYRPKLQPGVEISIPDESPLNVYMKRGKPAINIILSNLSVNMTMPEAI